jgi:hypothetical protein
MALSRLLLLLLVSTLSAADLEISRPARTWEFLDALGPKAGILGREDGTLEGYTYPLKIFKDLRLRFVLDGRVIPAESVARRIVSRPGSYTIIYSGDEYEVRETLAASADRAGAVIRLQVNAHSPVRIDVEFTRDFQLMWPASIGTSYGEWNAGEKAWIFGADGQPFAAVMGSPDAALIEHEYQANSSLVTVDRFTLGTIDGAAERVLAFGGSVKSRDEALAVYRGLVGNAGAAIAAAEKHGREYIASTVGLTLPDKELQAAYEWSKLSMGKGMVENPLLGLGLVAGYGPSKGVYRPGFAWFFGRDTFWTSLAMTSMGDLANTRAAIAFIAKYQREDGKIPHEVSQSASLVPWFQAYPYGYASADGTPLYVIAVHNYVQASGDAAFAREQWPRLRKAFDFMRANFEAHGFPKNYQVGHGWVEGGPLLPVDVEFYQAACYVEALRGMAALTRVVAGSVALAAQLDQEYASKRKSFEDVFWLPGSKAYAFALDTTGKAVDQPTVLSTVPMWFGELEPGHVREMIEQLSEESHQADWGMRIISSKSPTYGPEGYHFGSVWPLFTGWASVGEYRYHAAHAGYANLRANAWLTLDGAGGNPTEVLSGMTYSPLSTASPHQIWSAAMVVSPLLRGLCGLEVDAAEKRVTLAPHLPADWPGISIARVPVGSGQLDFAIERDEKSLRLRVTNRGAGNVRVHFSPAYSLASTLMAAQFDGAVAKSTVVKTATDQHPEFDLTVPPGEHTLTIQHQGNLGFSLPYVPPQLGAMSENLKIVSERWAANGRSVDVTVSGRASRTYRLALTGAAAAELKIEMPAGEGYVRKTVTLTAR